MLNISDKFETLNELFILVIVFLKVLTNCGQFDYFF